MAAFRLMGNIVHLGPREFHVFASAVSDEPAVNPSLSSGVAESRESAEVLLEVLLFQVGQRVRNAGDIVADLIK